MMSTTHRQRSPRRSFVHAIARVMTPAGLCAARNASTSAKDSSGSVIGPAARAGECNDHGVA